QIERKNQVCAQMEPAGPRVATTDADGRFTVTIASSRHTIMVMDRERARGALLLLTKGKEDAPVDVTIGPLVKLRGCLRGPGPGERPSWTHVYINLPDDPTRPLDSTRLVSCGSFEARFQMSLPPRHYVLNLGVLQTLGYHDRRPGDRRLAGAEARAADTGR